MMWTMILISVSLIAILGGLYLCSRALRFGFSKWLYEKNKALGLISSVWPIALCLPLLLVNAFAFVIAFVHLFVIWAISDLVVFIIRKIRRKEKAKRYINGFIALTLTAVYLTYGWVMAHNVIQTSYTVATDKNIGEEPIRIAMIADLHIGATLNGDEFAEQCKKINAQKPDIVLVCGDFLDDASTRSDILKACDALGTFDAKYGVYFIYGNHDRGYFRNKAVAENELDDRLIANGVKVLRDEVVNVNENICIVGREDGGRKNRKTADELMAGIDSSKFVIMLDHQPNDYDAIEKSAPDLVLSGHTHGGHVFPAGQIGLLIGANDQLYGLEKRGGTLFIVTSGISGWAIPFKTFAVSEFVIIDIISGV
jgi:predicted MPP superfamily phosphohydrolase